MNKKHLKIGKHVWFLKSNCCGGYHKKGEEGIITHIDSPRSFHVKSVRSGAGFWHELDCVSTHEGFFDDNLFEI